MGRAGFTGVEASHGIIVRCLEVNFGKGRRESGGFWFAFSQVRSTAADRTSGIRLAGPKAGKESLNI
jgi:hypothetical protein